MMLLFIYLVDFIIEEVANLKITLLLLILDFFSQKIPYLCHSFKSDFITIKFIDFIMLFHCYSLWDYFQPNILIIA